MTIRIYGIRNCDTMKKAFAWLEGNRLDYEFHDYKKEGVPPGKLKAWAARVGYEKLANMRGPTWRKIPDAKKVNLNEARMIALLEENTSAIKRPILEIGSKVLVGFDREEYAAKVSRFG
jgi:arsenate reductase